MGCDPWNRLEPSRCGLGLPRRTTPGAASEPEPNASCRRIKLNRRALQPAPRCDGDTQASVPKERRKATGGHASLETRDAVARSMPSGGLWGQVGQSSLAPRGEHKSAGPQAGMRPCAVCPGRRADRRAESSPQSPARRSWKPPGSGLTAARGGTSPDPAVHAGSATCANRGQGGSAGLGQHSKGDDQCLKRRRAEPTELMGRRPPPNPGHCHGSMGPAQDPLNARTGSPSSASTGAWTSHKRVPCATLHFSRR